jgi:hypothetical protein
MEGWRWLDDDRQVQGSFILLSCMTSPDRQFIALSPQPLILIQSTLVKGPRWFRARTSDLYESRTINFHDVIRAVVRVVSSFE